MVYCDKNERILEWGSEEIALPYRSPVDSKIHRYFVDFYIKVKSKDGKVGKYLVEIKPEKFTKPPAIPKKKTKRFGNAHFAGMACGCAHFVGAGWAPPVFSMPSHQDDTRRRRQRRCRG